MGLGPRVSGCDHSGSDMSFTRGSKRANAPSLSDPINTNPDPTNFEIHKIQKIGKYVVVRALYPNCINYEGLKVMVYRNTLKAVKNAGRLDPHFCEECEISPIARFEPTDEGFDNAVLFVEALTEDSALKKYLYGR